VELSRALADDLVAALPPECDRPRAPAELEPALRRLLERAAPGWHEVRAHAAEFVRFVAARLQSDRPIDEQLDNLHATDLALAWACSSERPGAVAAFEARFGASMRAVAARYAGDDVDAQDVVQGIRERLFGRAGASKIADYRGAGALHKWVEISIRRAGLDHVRARGRRPEIASDDERLDERVREFDPELEYMKEAYRGAFEQALSDALRSLEPRQRNVLRHRLVYAVQIEEIAAIYGVNRKTITRWIAAAQDQLLEAVRATLRARLQLPPEELTSLMRLVRSRLDFSLSAALRSSGDG
jgi:RNA polymerase sigma-70 factor (ECF subfamily)